MVLELQEKIVNIERYGWVTTTRILLLLIKNATMKRTFFLILLFFCALFVKADVLGPYTMDSNVPPTPTGYARVVLPIGGADASVAVSITVCDESGQQYVLRTTTPNAAPYCYFLAYGVYRVVA